MEKLPQTCYKEKLLFDYPSSAIQKMSLKHILPTFYVFNGTQRNEFLLNIKLIKIELIKYQSNSITFLDINY